MYQPHNARLWMSRHQQFLKKLGMALAAAIAVILLASQTAPAAKVSNYELAQAEPFNQVATYPLGSLPSSPDFRPNGNWLGRLILPAEQDYVDDPRDWVWFEVWHSPEGVPNLSGQIIKLTWQSSPQNQAYLTSITRDVNFTEKAEKALENGTILPSRLNGRQQVGPLQSLAGARPKDDMTVRMYAPLVELVTTNGAPELQTSAEPFQITGREYGLVKIIEPDTTVDAPLPEVCPGEQPCPTEYFRVQHFNTAAQDFSGTLETIRIPQQPLLKDDRFFSNIRDLAQSPAGEQGWYVYGSRDTAGIFTVQALKPRSLVQLDSDRVVLGTKRGLKYIDRQNWASEPQRKGTVQQVLVSPDKASADMAIADWQEGDFALVIHLFGGIGGENKELTPGGTVSGHFAYGLAQVVREPIAQELQFDVLYQQIYAHNSGGIISGTHQWESYNGDLQRGWLGIRPISDVVVKLDAFTDPFVFGNTTISLFSELLKQAQVLAARYRTGDGTGIATVTPAASCVQDSNQALFIAIEQIKRKIDNTPEIAEWIQQHPDSPEIDRIQRFIKVGTALENMLTPYGVVRPDWQYNAESLAGVDRIDAEVNFESPTGLVKGLWSGILSWRTMMPRWGHDEVSRVFLENGGQLWFLRTNMVGGNDPRVEPIPPTTLFGLVPILGRLVQRFTDAVVAWPSWLMFVMSIVALEIFALFALPYGFKRRFLKLKPAFDRPLRDSLQAVRIFFVPALIEEVVFRVFILPHPVEGIGLLGWFFWIAVSIGAFVLYHWALGKFFRKSIQATLGDRRFLITVGWLALVLAIVYRYTGSLWLVAFMHWAVVVVWIYGLGGRDRLSSVSARRDRASFNVVEAPQ